MTRPIRALIDTYALEKNLSLLRAKSGNRFLWGVVKANAYGHGLIGLLPIFDNWVDGLALLDPKEGVDIRKYSVIYDAIEEVKAAMEGMLAPELKEQVTATIEVREVFNITKVGLVAGAMVKTGKVKRSDKARLIRDGIVIFTGSINALKRFKDDVKEVGTNFECGISLTNCNDIKVGDIIESYEEIEVKQTL